METWAKGIEREFPWMEDDTFLEFYGLHFLLQIVANSLQVTSNSAMSVSVDWQSIA